jgi:hypothetical protein
MLSSFRRLELASGRKSVISVSGTCNTSSVEVSGNGGSAVRAGDAVNHKGEQNRFVHSDCREEDSVLDTVCAGPSLPPSAVAVDPHQHSVINVAAECRFIRFQVDLTAILL